jgi:hypothetical protein
MNIGYLKTVVESTPERSGIHMKYLRQCTTPNTVRL